MLQNLKLIILALLIGVGLNYASAAWTNPSVGPTGGNAQAPVNVSLSSQTKNGPLWANFLGSQGNIYANGTVRGTGLCIGSDCRTAWPVGGSGTVTGVTPGVGITGGGTSGNVTVGSRFGGVYVERRVILTVTCDTVNPFTGSCSCPAGFTNYLIGVLSSNSTPQGGSNVRSFLCML